MDQHTRLPFFYAFIAIVLMSLLAACGSMPVTTSASTSSAAPKATRVSLTAPFKVTRLGMDVSPSSLSSYACGKTVTVTYTAVFWFPANNTGGKLIFKYTLNGGRSSTVAILAVRPGQLLTTYTFSWSGQLSPSHGPGSGGVFVAFPNTSTSQLVAPSGICSTTTPFKVDSIGLAVSPAVTGHACGSLFIETYTATFHIEPGGPGGMIVFQYTVNTGRASSNNVSLSVAAGQTTATYKYYWSGQLDSGHFFPEGSWVIMSAPNQLMSPAALPTGACS